MAFDDTEIEIQIKIPDSSAGSVRAYLQKKCLFQKESAQKDTYFAPRHDNYFTEAFPARWLRVREEAKGCSANFKYWHANGTEHAYCDEHETSIGNTDAMTAIFAHMNFHPVIVVDKQRQTYLFEDKFEVALDRVTDLGTFVEVEALRDLGGVDATRAAIMSFIDDLGVSNYTISRKGYPYLLLEQTGAFADNDTRQKQEA